MACRSIGSECHLQLLRSRARDSCIEDPVPERNGDALRLCCSGRLCSFERFEVFGEPPEENYDAESETNSEVENDDNDIYLCFMIPTRPDRMNYALF
jgi:hypothetical protein